jgi:uncharacterized protein (TIGR03435 family)
MKTTLAALLVILGGGMLTAQEPVVVAPAFDVVVLKRNTSGDNSMSAGSRPGGVYTMVNGPISSIFGNAYRTPSNEIVGAPGWFTTERYDVTARIVGNPTPEQRQLLWRELFAERMKLQAHYDTREQPTYALVLARSDGRLGPNLRRSATDCAARTEAGRRGEQLPPAPQAANGMPACSSRFGPGSILSGGQTMVRIAQSISGLAGRFTVDRTGLSGDYEFTLEYASARPGDTSAADEPNIFTALQEQLGLKLEPTRGPVEIVVIDHIERPIVD